MTNELISKLEKFWEEYDEVLIGEWNQGLNGDDWQLLKDVKKELSK